ncbi:Pterin-binding domain protein [Acididesulfobacillus acetoxydans]|uniref:Methyltetrahydrofolate:corrinoid/iron-sulfur protein methyltransferase n=1 Tax=Acididesulfobacillus acetoxydans TaxID=1561005 RepID=A0A8S0W2D1_9FIRM|nr:methyltetrahydrofolate cobalamin methyltransferase [Acididesulfobacillus acetoxydans]CAA7600618.1 Pterin-binding domain protein [Acididesulfobacillus acetoxydans]CEJ09399.1 Methyltetrahydrofolate:corrinoid/iron-sulfur protein methyltransferase [Acididesulfobacillus acetoxydans]
MLIIGELINTSRKAIRPAVERKDTAFIQDLAQRQVEAGAHYVDVNCGTLVHDEVQTMEWLVDTVQEAVSQPLCIDTPRAEAMEAGLAGVKNGQPMVNSITAEKERYARILPLVLKYKAKVVALCMDDKGVPASAEERITIIRRLVTDLTADGVPEDDIYLDPLITPISTGDHYGQAVLETVRFIRREYPRVHAVCGLSNISYGLPNRKILNRAFMIQTMAAGMDAYILDPLDKAMMGFVYASQALLGQDSYCGQYLSAHRSGLFE